MVRGAVLGLFLALGLGLGALAQDKVELALQAVDAGFEPQVTNRIMDTLWPATEKLIRDKLPKTTDEQLAGYRTTIEGFARESAKSALVPMAVTLAETFSEDELKVLVSFYESPTGRKLNDSTTVITEVFAGEVTQRINQQIGVFQDRVEALIAAQTP